jgi:ectoine hydroxylase-related dioxygenase (phytanoyl-CoA dioxygenase family)
MASVLGQKRKSFWQENGFLVLPGFFDEHEIETVATAVRQVWRTLPDDVVVDDLVTNRRCRISKLSDAEKEHWFKVNDLYLTDQAVREVALSERLGMVLSELLEDQPVMCNTLNFDKGSQQIDHIDTLYMTPLSERSLVATWMAIEDTQADAGPLRYYPGSNHIPHYRFSTGSFHVHLAEMERWSDYMADQVERRGLEEQRFLAGKGDLFIWDALLLHGGSEICNPRLSRESLVTHFFTQSDCEQLSSDLRPARGGWWIRKPALPVPEEQVSASEPARRREVDFPRLPAKEASKPMPRLGLRERLDALRNVLD